MASWSGFYGDGQGTNGSYELLSGKSPNRYHLSRLFRKKGMRELSEVLRTIAADSTPASQASAAISRVQGAVDTTANVNGGVRTIESEQLVGLTINSDKDDASAQTARNITAADVTDLNLILADGGDENRAPSSYPVDISGNGGGGKLS